MNQGDYSPAGNPILRHEERKRDVEFVVGNEDTIEAVTEHVEQHIGKVDFVYHEVISDLVHIDILVIKPTKERDYYTLVTCGMSDLPMTVPEGAENFRYAELMICLPSNWQVSSQAFEQEENYWPIYWLKKLARLPHEYDTWLFHAHTIPNGDPAQPFAANTQFTGLILGMPSTVDNLEGFFTLPLSEEKRVHFFSVLPLYTEEMNLKLHKGAEVLFEKFEAAGINEIVNLKRKNVAKKRFLFF